jgi:hypothetical protein
MTTAVGNPLAIAVGSRGPALREPHDAHAPYSAMPVMLSACHPGECHSHS